MSDDTLALALEAWADQRASSEQRALIDRAWREEPALLEDLRLLIALRGHVPDRAQATWRALEPALRASSASQGRRTIRRVERRLDRPRRLRWLALAAIALLTSTLALLWYAADDAAAPRPVIAAVRGSGRLGDAPLPDPGSVWPQGATLTCDPGTEVVVALADGSRLRLLGARATRPARGAELLRLERGLLHASITPRQGNDPCAVGTPHGRAEVLGTAFALRAADAHSELSVYHGAVALRPHDRATAQTLTTGQRARCTASTVSPEAPLPPLDPRFGGQFTQTAAEHYASGAWLLDPATADTGLVALEAAGGAELADRVGANSADIAVNPADAMRIRPDARGIASARLVVDPEDHRRIQLRCRFRLERRRADADYRVLAGPEHLPEPLPPGLHPIDREWAIDDEDWHALTIDLLQVGRTAGGIPLRETLIRLDDRIMLRAWTHSLGAVLDLRSRGNPLLIAHTVVAVAK
ncbi:MAG: FecR domain-containing protein [Planctomycetota bacterium]